MSELAKQAAQMIEDDKRLSEVTEYLRNAVDLDDIEDQDAKIRVILSEVYGLLRCGIIGMLGE